MTTLEHCLHGSNHNLVHRFSCHYLNRGSLICALQFALGLGRQPGFPCFLALRLATKPASNSVNTKVDSHLCANKQMKLCIINMNRQSTRKRNTKTQHKNAHINIYTHMFKALECKLTHNDTRKHTDTETRTDIQIHIHKHTHIPYRRRPCKT